MHETSLVADLVDECERRAHGCTVSRVRVRHASSISDDGLRAIFAALTTEGLLAHALLDAEEYDCTIACHDCGYSGIVDHDHVYGPLRICPICGAISEDAGAPELELVDVELATSAASGGEASTGEEPVNPMD